MKKNDILIIGALGLGLYALSQYKPSSTTQAGGGTTQAPPITQAQIDAANAKLKQAAQGTAAQTVIDQMNAATAALQAKVDAANKAQADANAAVLAAKTLAAQQAAQQQLANANAQVLQAQGAKAAVQTAQDIANLTGMAAVAYAPAAQSVSNLVSNLLKMAPSPQAAAQGSALVTTMRQLGFSEQQITDAVTQPGTAQDALRRLGFNI